MLRSLLNVSGVRRQLIKIFADRPRNIFLCSPCLLHRLGLILALAVGIGRDSAAVNRRCLPADESKSRAAINDQFEHPSQDIAVSKSAKAVRGTSGSIRHAALKPKAAKPAIGKIEMNLVHQPPF